jgi:hypothetical protein
MKEIVKNNGDIMKLNTTKNKPKRGTDDSNVIKSTSVEYVKQMDIILPEIPLYEVPLYKVPLYW